MSEYNNIINNNKNDYILSQKIELIKHQVEDLNDILESYKGDELLKEYMKEIAGNIENYIKEIQELS